MITGIVLKLKSCVWHGSVTALLAANICSEIVQKIYQASTILLLIMKSGNKSSVSAARHDIVLRSFHVCSKVPLVDSLTSKSVRLLDDCSCLSVFFFFWCVQGSPYYDNVRPLCYSDSDAVLLCFDISRPDTVDSSLKKVRSLACVCRVWTYFCYLRSCFCVPSGKLRSWTSVPAHESSSLAARRICAQMSAHWWSCPIRSRPPSPMSRWACNAAGANGQTSVL